MTGSRIVLALLITGLVMPAHAQETLKERLGSKASDEQRADNCKVPPERRGPKPRPTGCAAAPSDPGANPRPEIRPK
ncbi:MAG: hypothetical protein K0R27_248 [Xanthobacteraceae bacterium]|jgi:hypothetical protein|nr:hypothetical protein [Xanthobacteraceae bacterium]